MNANLSQADPIPGHYYLIGRRKVQFIRLHEWSTAAIVQARDRKPFIAGVSQLKPIPENPRLSGALSVAEQFLLDSVTTHPGLSTANLAAIANRDPDRKIGRAHV